LGGPAFSLKDPLVDALGRADDNADGSGEGFVDYAASKRRRVLKETLKHII
jgi:hypothetical protein